MAADLIKVPDRSRLPVIEVKPMPARTEVIETTVSEVAAELARRGLDPDDRITITIEPDERIPGRRASRARVIAAGLTDDDIDRLIKQAQQGVEPPRLG
jgi:hypothetical protein